MHIQAKVQKWGNSSAVRLPTRALAAAGISVDSDVEIEATQGCLVIKLKQPTKEQALDKLLAESPEMEELLALVKTNLSKAIEMTEHATMVVESTHENLSTREAV